MLTISQLASYAGVTVRAVRHYHAKGLLPEPERDHSGYRRYDAQAVVELIRIRTLAEAGVPLSRVKELLSASPQEFIAAVRDVDERLRAEIRDRQQHRERIAQLAAGDSLALPPEVVGYLERCREIGVPTRVTEVERDSWILIAAQIPDQVPALMAMKLQQIETPLVRELYDVFGTVVDCAPDDPQLPALADRIAAFFDEAMTGASPAEVDEAPFSAELIELLDAAFVDSFAAGRELLRLLEQRGWYGWTMVERRER